MSPSNQEISDAIVFAVSATDRQCENEGMQAPGLEGCRFSLFVALMGKLGRGQMRLAVLDSDPSAATRQVVFSAENLVFVVDHVFFDEQGFVEPEKLLVRVKNFNNAPDASVANLVLVSPVANMLQEFIDQTLVKHYRKFLDVAFDGAALQQATPSVEAPSTRPRL